MKHVFILQGLLAAFLIGICAVTSNGESASKKVTKHVATPCKFCKDDYRLCLKDCKDTAEDSVEVETCQEEYQECFHVNRCYVEGAR